MAKKETKLTKKEVIDKTIKTIETIIVPAIIGAGAIWNFDVAVYVAAVASAVIGILKCVEVFIK